MASQSLKGGAGDAGEPRRRHRRRIWIGVFAVLGISLLAAVWFVRPAVRWLRVQEAERKIAEVERLMEEERFDEAAELTMEAFESASRSPKVLRKMVELTSMGQQNLSSCLYFLRRLEEVGSLEPADRRTEAAVLARLGRTDEALRLIRELIDENPEDGAHFATLATVHESMGSTTDAVSALERAVALDPENLEYALRLAWDRTKSTFSDVRNTGWTGMWELAADQSKVGLRALEMIAESAETKEGRPLLYGKEQTLVELMENHPLAKREHQLTALTWRVRTQPEDREALVARATEGWETASEEEQIMVVEWLARSGSTDEILSLLPLEKAKKRLEFFQAYLNALGLQERWDDIQSALEASSLPISEGQVHYSLARLLAFSSPDDPRIAAEVAKAIAAAGRTGDVVLAMNSARLADSMGLREVSERGYEIAARSREYATEAFGRILSVARMNHQADRLVEIAGLIEATRHPDADLEEEAVYLNLLLGNAMELYAQRAQDLVDLRPSSARRNLINALAAYRMGDLESVRSRAAAIDPELLNSGMKALLAGFLAGGGEQEKAAEVAEEVSRSMLLPQELAFLDQAGAPSTAAAAPSLPDAE